MEIAAAGVRERRETKAEVAKGRKEWKREERGRGREGRGREAARNVVSEAKSTTSKRGERGERRTSRTTGDDDREGGK